MCTLKNWHWANLSVSAAISIGSSKHEGVRCPRSLAQGQATLATTQAPSNEALEASREGEDGVGFFESVASVPKPEDDRKLPATMPHNLKRPQGLPRPKQRRRPQVKAGPEVKAGPKAGEPENHVTSIAGRIRDLPDGVGVGEVLCRNLHRLRWFEQARLIRELGQKMSLASRACEVFVWLQDNSLLVPNDTALRAVIQVMVQAGDVKTACKLAQSAQQSPALVSQSLAIALAEAGMVESAIKALDRLELVGTTSEVALVYGKLIAEASRLKSRSLVEDLLDRMKEKSVDLKLEECSAAMAACSKVGLLDAAESLFDSYKARGSKPNVIMYTCLISARARAGKHREAAAVVWEMEEAGCSLDLMGYQVVMGALGELEDLPKVSKMFKKLKADGFSPTLDIYNVLVKLYCKEGRVGKAKDLVKEMEQNGCIPNEQTKAYLTG